MKQHFGKLAMIVVLGSCFAVAQSTPATSPQSTSPSTQSPSSTDQQPATSPDQSSKPANAPETMPSTDQPKSDSSKLPQSDAAPSAAATGDVQGNIQSAIQKDPSLSSSNVTVNVTAGKSVDLTGTVPTKDAKDSAERIAKENSGGLKVKNHLKVAGASSDTTPKTDTNAPKL
ncbi:MAG TPA: BON domain-containing protein [Candidatus Angelobacter sp.]|nr:BON domain-containing protein [Candidatus Angelobacter sp.]